MGNSVKKRVDKYDQIGIVLIFLLFLGFILTVCSMYTHPYDERKVRIEVNRLVYSLKEKLQTERFSELPEIGYPYSVYDEEGKVLYSTADEAAGTVRELCTLGGSEQYIVPVVSGERQGIRCIRLKEAQRKRLYQQTLLLLVYPVLSGIVLYLLYRKKQQSVCAESQRSGVRFVRGDLT